jgi:hypothetical protein
MEEKLKNLMEQVKNEDRTEIINGESLTLDQELKIIKALTKIFSEATEAPTNEEIDFEFLSVVDDSHIIMCQAKNKIANKILSKFYHGSVKVPTLSYSDDKIKNGSKFAYDFLEAIMSVFKPFNVKKFNTEPINIITGEDKPLIISNEYFTFLLAPRIESE